jgi:hypothetical protein
MCQNFKKETWRGKVLLLACLAFEVLLAVLKQAEGDWAIIARGSKQHGRSNKKNAECE